MHTTHLLHPAHKPWPHVVDNTVDNTVDNIVDNIVDKGFRTGEVIKAWVVSVWSKEYSFFLNARALPWWVLSLVVPSPRVLPISCLASQRLAPQVTSPHSWDDRFCCGLV